MRKLNDQLQLSTDELEEYNRYMKTPGGEKAFVMEVRKQAKEKGLVLKSG